MILVDYSKVSNLPLSFAIAGGIPKAGHNLLFAGDLLEQHAFISPMMWRYQQSTVIYQNHQKNKTIDEWHKTLTMSLRGS